MSTPPPAAPVSTDVVAIEQALTRVAYLAGRARQHERLMAVAGLNLDRAAAAILRSIAESEPVRPECWRFGCPWKPHTSAGSYGSWKKTAT